MIRILHAVCFLVGISAVAKEQPKFAVSDIPDDLKQNVDIVYREDQAIFTILTRSKATFKVYQVITIFNSNGKGYAEEVVGYDKLTKITTLKGNVYNDKGELVKKLKSSEIYDQSAFDGYSLYSDNRLKRIDLSYGIYPYTVEIEYELEYKFLFSIPGYWVLPMEKASVQHGLYKLIYPVDLAPRYKAYHIESQPVKEIVQNIETLSWTFQNIKPIKFDPLSPPAKKFLPHISAAPTHFEYDGYVGKMDTWNEFGKWIGVLNKGRDVLPEATKQLVKSLVANAKTDEEKIRIVYEYLQNKTRYVSIQLGIGGLQPFEAGVVDKTGYGDCKALSNYTVAVLKELGIKAHYTLINAGRGAEELDESFPSAQFNHAIVSVPNGGDTLWLECTSQTNPFGYMGYFTGDRKALLITDDGAKVVNTLRYTPEHNVQSRTALVVLSISGDATAKVKTTYKGLQYENSHLNSVLSNQYDKQKEWIQENTQIPSFDISGFNFKNRKERIPTAEVSLDLILKRLGTTSGKRIFLTPNLMNRSTYIPEKVEARKTKVMLNVSFTDYDTIRYTIPPEIYAEFLPEPVKITSRFGEYEAAFTIDQGNVVYMRKLKRYKGEFPVDSYKELIDFYRSINKADNTKIVFLNKT